jgi:hypothetical protein
LGVLVVASGMSTVCLGRLGAFFCLLGALACDPPQTREPVADAVEVRKEPDDVMGPVYARIAGNWSRIAPKAWDAWLLEQGRAVVYSSDDGAGGFENEGHSLHRYDVAKAESRLISKETALVDEVALAVSNSGRSVYLVSLRDGGLGAPQLTAVTPSGEVLLRRGLTRLEETRGGRIRISTFRIEELESRDPDSAKPDHEEWLDLDELG